MVYIAGLEPAAREGLGVRISPRPQGDKMVTVIDLIGQLEIHDLDLEVGVYIDTTSYGSYYVYEDGCVMHDPEDDKVFITPSGVPIE